MRSTWILVLGGGGLYGVAHLGALQVLKDHIPVGAIVGTSAGSIAGACYAQGIPPREVLRRLQAVSWVDLIRPTMGKGGLLDTSIMKRAFTKILDEHSFSRLAIPLTAVATDICTGETVALNEGDMLTAICASSAVPGIFTPVEIENRTLVDGGVTSNVPVETAHRLYADMSSLAVNLTGHGELSERPGAAHEVILRSLQLLQKYKSSQEAGAADIAVTPDLSGLGFLQVESMPEMFERGRRAAERTIEKMEDG